jgi:sporulation-control protein spo0M
VLSLGNKIDVSVSGLPLGQVAAKFDRLLARDVLVPASRVKKTVRLRLKGVSVSAAIRALGLRTQKAVKPRPSKRRAGR